MWVLPQRSMVGDYGYLKRGKAVDLDEVYAKKLIDSGRAIPDPDNGGNSKAPAKAKQGAKATANPSEPRRTGGRTGAAKPSSVSAEGQAPGKKTSRKSAKPEQG